MWSISIWHGYLPDRGQEYLQLATGNMQAVKDVDVRGCRLHAMAAYRMYEAITKSVGMP